MKNKPRIKRGRDWHGWAWKFDDTTIHKTELGWWAECDKPKRQPVANGGKWVRVKFVEVV